MKHSTLLFAILLMMASCQKQIEAPAEESNTNNVYKEIKNEPYGTDTAQRADIYLPAGRSSSQTKVVVLLHGGAWNSGDKVELNDFVQLLRAKYPELALVNANYRLAGPASRHPAQMTDIEKLLTYIRTKSSTWNISNSNYALGGFSAGAHLSMLYAYKYDTTRMVKVVLSVVGPTNFLDPYYVNNLLYAPLVQNYIGQPIADSASYRNASPAHVVTAGAQPTYMAYGGLDPLVPVSNAVMLDQKLTALNVPHQYDFFPAEGHVFSMSTYDTVARKMVAFLKQHQ